MTNNNKILIIVLIVVLVLLLFGGLGFGIMGGGIIGSFGFGGLFMILAYVLAIWVIYDVIVNNKGLSDGMKILWIILAIILSIITAIVYYLVGRDKNRDLFRRR